MDKFVFYNPTKVYFGENVWQEALNTEMQNVGKNIMLAYGGGSIKKSGLFDKLVELLNSLGKNVIEFGGIMPNPTYNKVCKGADICKQENVDFIVAVGGGSVIDCAKVLSAQAVIDEDLWNRQFDKHKKVEKWIPFGSIVTASGTGAEMNDHGVITNTDLNRKAGVNGGKPSFAILDPILTLTVPKMQVMSGAFDSLSHAYETYLGTPRNENISDDITEAVMRSIIKNMKILKQNVDDVFARGELMWDSALAENGILKIGKVGAFQVHQLEHQLGAYTDCNHGQGLAALHPYVYKHIYKTDLKRFARLARTVWLIVDDDDENAAIGGIEALENFIKDMGLPTSLRELNVDKTCFKKVAESCNVLDACSKKLDKEEFLQILYEAY